jgi:allantoinase
MSWETIIRGGTVVLPSGALRADIAIEDGLVAALEPELTAPASGARPPREIDARGLTIFPGVIDSHVHFNDPGRGHWEGIATGSRALAAGGGTCFVDMPLNSSPPTLDGASFDAKLAVAEASACTDFAFYGGLTPESLSTMPELAERGVVGFKAFMCPSGIEDFTWADDETLYRGMEIAHQLDLPVLLHAESAAITATLTAAARSAGRQDVRAYLDSRPVRAELEAISRALLYAEETGCRVHSGHVTNPRGVARVRRAAAAGWADATCETCPHYLYLTETDMEQLGGSAKCAPPLRPEATRRALLEALVAGEIDTVGSDHSPAPGDIKNRPDFFEAWGGIAGVQATLRVLLTLGVPDTRIATVLGGNPARLFRLTGKGEIAVGNDADLALVATGDRTAVPVRREELRDRHRLSPYVGRTLSGRIEMVLLRGRTITDETRGRLIRPHAHR